MDRKDTSDLPIRSFDSKSTDSISKCEIVRTSSSDGTNNASVEPHRHDYYHIMLVKNGVGKHTIDFTSYDMKPNTLFFVSPGQVHSFAMDGEYDGYILTFNSEFYLLRNDMQTLLNYPFFHSISSEPYLYLDDSNTKIHTVFDDLYDEYTSEVDHQENILRALLDVLLIRTLRSYTHTFSNGTPMYLTYQLRKLELLIDSHFKESKLLADYADMMFLSTSQLNSICKKGLNKTVTNLIHERILLEARRLLLFTDKTVEEIAYELGFTEKSYFMRFFKKHQQLTADAYRKQRY